MFIEHVNRVVSDMEATLGFYKAAFPDWQVRGGGKGEWYGKPRNWLHFGDDRQYLAFSDHGTGGSRDLKGHTSGLAHFAFVTNNIAAVRQRLEGAGFQPSNLGSFAPDVPEEARQFRQNIYYVDPDGVEVEFVEYLSDLMSQRNDYAAS